MKTMVGYKLELLDLVNKEGSITFVDVDKILHEANYSNFIPEYFLYRTVEREDLAWFFYSKTKLELVAELLQKNALELKKTNNVTYGKTPFLTTSTAKKFTYLMNHTHWIPTVLVKGENFNKERESLTNVTS